MKYIDIMYCFLCGLLGVVMAHFFSVLQWQWWVIVFPACVGFAILEDYSKRQIIKEGEK